MQSCYHNCTIIIIKGMNNGGISTRVAMTNNDYVSLARMMCLYMGSAKAAITWIYNTSPLTCTCSLHVSARSSSTVNHQTSCVRICGSPPANVMVRCEHFVIQAQPQGILARLEDRDAPPV